jgi:beta-lactamase regulating signal transducer with metallopeptidase domain
LPIDRAQPASLWLATLMGLWLAGVAAGLARLLVSVHRVGDIVRRSTPIGPDGAALAGSVAAALGLGRIPETRVSKDIQAPQAAGPWRPIVLLPATAVSEWSQEELRMAVGHEMVHIRRRDLWLGWVPALTERLFFFHPLARLAVREYLVAREAACDAVVLRTLDINASEYGRLLVRLGVGQSEPAFAGASSSSASALRRRLEMLTHTTPTASVRRRRLTLAAALVLAMLPFQLVARTEPSAAALPSAPNITSIPPVVAPGATQIALPMPQRASAAVAREPGRSAQDSPREVPPRTTEAPEAREVERVRGQEREVEKALTQPRDGLRDADSVVETQKRVDQQFVTLRAQLESLRRLAQEQGIVSPTQQRRLGEDTALENRVRELEALNRLLQEKASQASVEARPQQEAAQREVQLRVLNEQIMSLTRQQAALVRQQQNLADQQQALDETMRRLSEQLQRVRETLEQSVK